MGNTQEMYRTTGGLTCQQRRIGIASVVTRRKSKLQGTHNLDMRILPFAPAILLFVGCSTLPTKPEPAQQGGRQEFAGLAWKDVHLPGKSHTRYSHHVESGRPVVYAESENSASMLRRPVRVEPADLGSVKFSWQVKQLIAAADLTDRDTDDSPVRLILAFDGDHGRLSLRNRMMYELAHAVTGETPPFATLMYVWDNKAPAETVIHSGRTDRIRKIVLESGQGNLGTWRHYERDIAADYRKTFGEEPGALIAIGLMTDSDNTRSSAKAWYGEVRLAAPDGKVF